jgi:hypothetical protein
VKRGILAVMMAYDDEREAYIRSLEKRIDELETQRNEILETSIRQAGTSSAMLLRGIMAGAFDRPSPPLPGEDKP